MNIQTSIDQDRLPSKKMLEFSEIDLLELPLKRRIRLHNSLLGAKPVHMVGSQSLDGVDNLAVFNSACHVTSNPPLIGIMSRPLNAQRDTYRNIKQTGVWSMNAITDVLLEQAHKTADKYAAAVSEFDQVGLQVRRQAGFAAPFVAASPVQLGLRLQEEVVISSSDTVMLVGQVVHLRLPADALLPDASLSAESAGVLSSLGLDAYACVSECARFVYAGTSS